MVAIAFPPALTRKRLAVSVSNSEAYCARLGGVIRLNCNQFHSKLQALVNQEDTQLIERPNVSSTPFFLATRFLVQVLSDASQIFYSYYFFVVSSRLDNAITNRMVEPSLKSSLLTRQPSQKSSAPMARTSRDGVSGWEASHPEPPPFMDSQSTRNFWLNRRVDPVTTISKALKRGINLLCHFLHQPQFCN